jgi:hypothetical protein
MLGITSPIGTCATERKTGEKPLSCLTPILSRIEPAWLAIPACDPSAMENAQLIVRCSMALEYEASSFWASVGPDQHAGPVSRRCGEVRLTLCHSSNGYGCSPFEGQNPKIKKGPELLLALGCPSPQCLHDRRAHAQTSGDARGIEKHSKPLILRGL